MPCTWATLRSEVRVRVVERIPRRGEDDEENYDYWGRCSQLSRPGWRWRLPSTVPTPTTTSRSRAPETDALYGYASNDRTYGGYGDDLIKGGAGNDAPGFEVGPAAKGLYGGSGHDTPYGGSGGDFVEGDVGGDLLSGGAGEDRIDGLAGESVATYDKIYCGDGADFAEVSLYDYVPPTARPSGATSAPARVLRGRPGSQSGLRPFGFAYCLARPRSLGYYAGPENVG